MILNEGNKIQGIYNGNTAPLEVMFTEGDIVIFDEALYVCLQDTQSRPNLTDGKWEVYMGDNWAYANSLNEILNANSNKTTYVGPKGLSDYFKNKLAGLNSDGKVQILSDASLYPLASLTKNSVFQLDSMYLNDSTLEVLPFTYEENCVYLVKTLAELTLNNTETYFVQELYKYRQDGSFEIFIRSGEDLATATFRPVLGESFNNDYIDGLNRLVQKYKDAETAYTTLVNEIHSGSYYSFQRVTNANITAGTVTFKEFITEDNVLDLDINHHYKILLVQQVSDKTYNSFSLDICPDDFLFSSESGSRISFLDGLVTLDRDTFTTGADPRDLSWKLNTTATVTRVLKAKNLIS